MSIVIHCFKNKCGLYLTIVIIADSKLLMSLIISAFFLRKELSRVGWKLKKISAVCRKLETSGAWPHILWLGRCSRTMWAFCCWLTRGQQLCSLMSARKNARHFSFPAAPHPASRSSPESSKAVWVNLWPASWLGFLLPWLPCSSKENPHHISAGKQWTFPAMGLWGYRCNWLIKAWIFGGLGIFEGLDMVFWVFLFNTHTHTHRLL